MIGLCCRHIVLLNNLRSDRCAYTPIMKLIFFSADILRFKKKRFPSHVLACLSSFKHGIHMLGLPKIHKRY